MDKYKLVSIENNVLTFSVTLATCNQCGQPMQSAWQSGSDLYHQIRKMPGVEQEHYRVSGMCSRCVESGKYSVECCICDVVKKMPHDFRFFLTKHPDHADDETSEYYVCMLCTIDRAQDTIRLLAGVDDIKELRR